MSSRTGLGARQLLLKRHLPSWYSGLAVAEHEDAERVPLDTHRGLNEAVHEAVAQRQGPRNAMLTGGYPGLSLFLRSSRKTFPPELNKFSVEIVDTPSVEGQDPRRWAWEFFREVPLHMPVRYGNAHLDEEFAAENLDTTDGGARALGVHLHKSLPGVYWLNFFGKPYLKLIGKDRLRAAPAYKVEAVDDGVLIALEADPATWKTPAYQDRERRTLEHLGTEYFYRRDHPEAKTSGAHFVVK